MQPILKLKVCDLQQLMRAACLHKCTPSLPLHLDKHELPFQNS